MLALISLFFPTFITLSIIRNRESKSYKELMFYYPIYNIIINVIVFSIYVIKKRNEMILISSDFAVLRFNLRYMILASFVAILIPVIKDFFKKNIKIKLEIRKDKKK